MNRRKLLALFGLPSLLMLGGGVFAATSRNRNPYYSGPVTANFNGVRFTDGRPVTKGFREFLQWQWQGGREAWPDSFAAPAQDVPPASVSGLRVVHLGHASFLIQTGGLNLLIDPVFSERASPFQFAGPKRVNAPGVAFDKLPKIDAVLITHNHYDHLDLNTLERIEARDKPLMILPLGNDAIVRERLPGARLQGHDWGAEIALSDNVKVTLVASYHWSARGALDRRMALWASFVISTPAGKVYHIGDTGFHDGAIFRQHGEQHGPFKLAILPIGAYEPRWFMADNHMNPDEAVEVMLALKAEQAIGHHWGTFQLTNEGIEKPRLALAAAVAAKGLSAERFTASQPGQVWQPGTA
ncbi:MAG: MBL fold metallo-hydrolase [Bosea sp. (in: a-proteobacteria)]